MKNLFKVAVAAGVIGLVSQAAFADVTGLTARLAGSCRTANTTGACTIKVAASGSSLGSDSVLLLRAATSNGNYRYVSNRARTLSDTGTTTFKFRNADGCYKVVTAPNGNDSPDVRSRAVCEK